MKDKFSSMTETNLHMSNIDHSIDGGLAEALKEGENKLYAQHAAWNFCGYVWYENDKFHEVVYRHNAPVGEFEADNLDELMTIVNNEYGYE